jgi:hypothetical protein
VIEQIAWFALVFPVLVRHSRLLASMAAAGIARCTWGW